MVVGCAFAKPNTTITSIRLPASAKIGIEAGIASYNLTSLASFVALEGSPYINGAHGTLLWSSSVGKATILIPPALEGFSLTNPFVFEDTTVVGRLDSLYKHTAIPAISRFLRERDPATTARVLVEVDPANELAPIPTDPRVELTLLVRGTDSLAEALAALQPSDRPDGALLGFVAAEAAIVPVARELLLVRWGLAPESTITKGYWRIDPK